MNLNSKGLTRTIVRLAVMGIGGLLPATNCATELRDAAYDGVYQFVTQSTLDLLLSVSPIPTTGETDDTNGTGDPFDDPPIQS